MHDYFPRRGRWPFVQIALSDRTERRLGLRKSGLVFPVQRDPSIAGGAYWVVRSSGKAMVLRIYYRQVLSVYYRAIHLMWRLGLIEFDEGATFSWRRNFRPFPWRGLKRERLRRA